MARRRPAVPSTRPEEEAFLRDIVASGGDESLYLILADWLEEHDDPRRAELLRLHRRMLATCCLPERHPERAQWQARIVALLAEGVVPSVPRVEVAEMTFAWCPPGKFLMGSRPNDMEEFDVYEMPQRVPLTRGFWLGVTPVTQAQWRAIMGTNPSRFSGDHRPVEQVSWEDCRILCDQLRERTEEVFRLPTEAEWEYACRAGTTTPFQFGDTITSDQANYNGNYPYRRGKKSVFREQTTAVNTFPPNAWSFFDMHGNVKEWCADWYDLFPPGNLEYAENINSSSTPVQRGGSWIDGASFCRSASRDQIVPGARCSFVGCRLVLCLD